MAVGTATPSSGTNGSAAQDGAAPRGAAPQQRRAAPVQRRSDGHKKDPLKPAAADGSGDDYDFDDPSQEAPRRDTAPKKPAAGKPTKKPAETNGKGKPAAAPAAKPARQARAIPPEAGGGDVVDGFDEGSTDDPYERLAQRHDAKEGKRSPAAGRKAEVEPKKPAAKPAARRESPAAEETEEAELEVGDEINEAEDDDAGETAETDEDDAFTHPILLEAKSYGFSEEEAREFGSVEHLQKAMEVIDRNLKKLGAGPAPVAANEDVGKKPADGSQTGQTLPENGRSAETGKTPTDSSSAAKLGNGERAFPKLSPADFDPENYLDPKSHGILSKIVDHYDGIVHDAHAQVRALKEAAEETSAKFESLTAHYREQNHVRFTEEMNGFFDGLDEKYAGIFGTGDIEDMDPESSEYKNRQGLIGEMNELAKGLRASKTPLSKKRLRERALRLFKPAVEQRDKQIRQEAIKQERRRNSQRIAPPTGRTGRTGKDRSPEDRAGDFVDSRYQELGFRVDPHSYDDNDDEI